MLVACSTIISMIWILRIFICFGIVLYQKFLSQNFRCFCFLLENMLWFKRGSFEDPVGEFFIACWSFLLPSIIHTSGNIMMLFNLLVCMRSSSLLDKLLKMGHLVTFWSRIFANCFVDFPVAWREWWWGKENENERKTVKTSFLVSKFWKQKWIIKCHYLFSCQNNENGSSPKWPLNLELSLLRLDFLELAIGG